MIISVLERRSRDRAAPRARRDQGQHPHPVPQRGDPARPARRPRRCRTRDPRHRRLRPHQTLGNRHPDPRLGWRPRRRLRDRRDRRPPSRDPRSPSRANRRPPHRLIGAHCRCHPDPEPQEPRAARRVLARESARRSARSGGVRGGASSAKLATLDHSDHHDEPGLGVHRAGSAAPGMRSTSSPRARAPTAGCSSPRAAASPRRHDHPRRSARLPEGRRLHARPRIRRRPRPQGHAGWRQVRAAGRHELELPASPDSHLDLPNAHPRRTPVQQLREPRPSSHRGGVLGRRGARRHAAERATPTSARSVGNNSLFSRTAAAPPASAAVVSSSSTTALVTTTAKSGRRAWM